MGRQLKEARENGDQPAAPPRGSGKVSRANGTSGSGVKKPTTPRRTNGGRNPNNVILQGRIIKAKSESPAGKFSFGTMSHDDDFIVAWETELRRHRRACSDSIDSLSELVLGSWV